MPSIWTNFQGIVFLLAHARQPDYFEVYCTHHLDELNESL